ncbi:hypothetical protein KTAU_33220 [Thermogemmatispora aurantia]|uniref:Uncharacterized protein n=1 Tax=Thermogemmatispora aurantia TaxID=2045279 RepID=A0A5J4KFL0_9CHLR|nr:hypothetical protein KTAU_33220 [Thermogemmatispora aurantia]
MICHRIVAKKEEGDKVQLATTERAVDSESGVARERREAEADDRQIVRRLSRTPRLFRLRPPSLLAGP